MRLKVSEDKNAFNTANLQNITAFLGIPIVGSNLFAAVTVWETKSSSSMSLPSLTRQDGTTHCSLGQTQIHRPKSQQDFSECLSLSCQVKLNHYNSRIMHAIILERLVWKKKTVGVYLETCRDTGGHWGITVSSERLLPPNAGAHLPGFENCSGRGYFLIWNIVLFSYSHQS